MFAVSGGQGDDEVRSETDAMAEYLRARGVPDDRIVREDRSVNTRQNLRLSAALWDGTTQGHRAAVVTSVYRTSLLAHRVGLSLLPAVPVATAVFESPGRCPHDEWTSTAPVPQRWSCAGNGTQRRGVLRSMVSWPSSIFSPAAAQA
ncbi:YdcF family protein [Streptomyces sp. XY006]|uniref:YdcF family protein n=1 Tax=Streptomyces sp. XY006 TaxID=2021410 RepID=UPI0015C5F668|nr:YdcF family protein [Streptomyces sp. XY006]